MQPERGRRRWARSMFYAHLWLGVAATGVLLLVSITGVLLNHKRALGPCRTSRTFRPPTSGRRCPWRIWPPRRSAPSPPTWPRAASTAWMSGRTTG